MSNANEASMKTKLRTGIFSALALIFMATLTVYVNNRPFWWRTCEPVQITVEDATGLKVKSPVRSLGLEIGYIADIGLVPSGVKVRICVTAPVEVQAETKAYVRAEGFLGDRFLELKPVKYTGNHTMGGDDKAPAQPGVVPEINQSPSNESHSSFLLKNLMWSMLGITTANAQTSNSNEKHPAKTVPVGGNPADMQQVMSEMKDLTTSLKESINPEEIRGTIRQLNKTLEDASRALSPQGGLTATAQRSLIKLEDAIEQLRDQITRINQGQGSVGMVLNDPAYAEEMKKVLQNMNHLLNRASEIRLNVSLALQELSAFHGARATFDVVIWPRPDRFYHVGLSSDPRGKVSQRSTTTYYNGTSNGPVTTTTTDQGGYAFTAMIGKHLNRRLDISVGLLYGDGAASLNVNLGPQENLESLQVKGDLYFRSKDENGTWTSAPDGRIYALYQPFSIFYLSGGIEGFRLVNDKLSVFYGGGIRFDDEDIRLLFSFL
jgi:phospholipid/cholesterol/gamma-HCH transport system substrate-binding protein